MKKRLWILLLLLLIVVAAQAQPLVATSSLSITFTPTLIQETVEEGHEEGNTLVSPVVRLRWAYRVN